MLKRTQSEILPTLRRETNPKDNPDGMIPPLCVLIVICIINQKSQSFKKYLLKPIFYFDTNATYDYSYGVISSLHKDLNTGSNQYIQYQVYGLPINNERTKPETVGQIMKKWKETNKDKINNMYGGKVILDSKMRIERTLGNQALKDQRIEEVTRFTLQMMGNRFPASSISSTLLVSQLER